jgi:hypothetical protein
LYIYNEKTMKKIIRLTESDLVRLVKIISEEMSKLTPENSLVGKTYNLEGKKICVIDKAYKLPQNGGFLVLPKEGCRKSGIVDGVSGYVYMSEINGGSMMSRFEWAGDNWVSEPSYNLGNVTISAPTQTTTTTPNTTQSTTVTTKSTTTKPNTTNTTQGTTTNTTQGTTTNTTQGTTTNTTQGTTTSQAKINTTNDRAYDYKLENGKYFFKGKQGTSAGTKYPNWIEATGTGLTNIKQYVKF